MSNNEKVLTVVIPSYNVEKYLPEVLPFYLDDSVLEFIEILIINDGSIDNTALVASEFEKCYPQTVKLINKINGGHGSTINCGIQEARGKYLKVIDGDDWVDTEGFVNLVERLKSANEDLIMNPYYRVNVDTNLKLLNASKGLVSDCSYVFDDVILNLIDSYQLHSNTFKTSILKSMNKIDEHCFYVDQEYIIYPIDRIKTMLYLSFPVYQYRVGNSDQSMSLKNMQKNRNMHKRVIMSLLSFLELNEHTANIQLFLKNKIKKMCQLQLDIYFSMINSSESYNEVMSFLNDVKTHSRDVYRGIPGKKAACLRLFGNKGYKIIRFIKGIGN